MIDDRPSSAPPVTLAELTLDLEQDIVRLCRCAREAGERLGLREGIVQRLCAAGFEAGQVFQARGAGSRATLLLAHGRSLDIRFDIRRPSQLSGANGLQPLLTSIGAMVPRVLAAPGNSGATVTVGVELPAAATAGLAPSLSHLRASDQRLGAAAVPAVPTAPGAAQLPQTDLERGFLTTDRHTGELSAELSALAEQLHLAEHRQQLLLDSVEDYAICLLTIDGQVSTANVGAERLFGCPAAEMVGHSVDLFYPAAEREAGLPAAQLVRAARDGRFESTEARFRRRGASFEAHVVLTPVRDAARVLRGFSFVVRDMTDRMRLEADLRRRAEDLAAANRAKEDFLATLSHELRTPLNAMLGWTRLLRMGTLDAAGAERALATIERNAHLQEQLIADILDVSRIVTGKLRLVLRPVDLAPIVDASLDGVRPTADAKGVGLRARLQTPGPVHGDPDRLQQVVWNLLANAIKFTPARGQVTVDLVLEGDAAVVRVADTGQGIDSELLPYIFDRFRQGDASVTRPHGGIGLGLSIVRHLVELHGGQVTVESAGTGQGATFSVSLPLRHPAGRAAAGPAEG